MNSHVRMNVNVSVYLFYYLQVGEGHLKHLLVLHLVHAAVQLLHGQVHDTRVIRGSQHGVGLPSARGPICKHCRRGQETGA